MRKTILERLIEARDRIAKPGGWTRRTFARDAEGLPCDFADSNAVCFCSLGAIGVASMKDEGDVFAYVANDVREALANAIAMGTGEGTAEGEMISSYIARWNDNPERTQSEVVAMFDKAIEAEKAKEAQ